MGRLRLNLREFVTYEPLPDGRVEARVDKLDLRSVGSDETSAFQALRDQFHRRMEDEEFRPLFSQFIQEHGEPESDEEYNRAILTHMRGIDETADEG